MDADEYLMVSKKRFILLDEYHISNNRLRRMNVSRILTGEDKAEGNNNISFFKILGNTKMYYAKCTFDSHYKNVIQFFNKYNRLISVCAKDNNGHLYLFLIENHNKNTSRLLLDNRHVDVTEILKGNLSINQIISSIIKNDLQVFTTQKPKFEKAMIKTDGKEQIEIIKEA